MLLDLRDLREPDALVERSYPPSSLAAGGEDDYVGAAPVELSLRVRKDGDRYRLFGQIVTTVRRDCCRCLKSFEVPTTLNVDLRYLPRRVNVGEGEHEIAEDDLSTGFYRDEQIDLGGLVREQLQLAAPMKPLCRDDCRGLCPVCGADWNTDTCRCDTTWRDPRLEALQLLFPKAMSEDEAGDDGTARARKD